MRGGCTADKKEKSIDLLKNLVEKIGRNWRVDTTNKDRRTGEKEVTTRGKKEGL